MFLPPNFSVWNLLHKKGYVYVSDIKLLTLSHLPVHPIVKLIALLGVSQRLWASQNILGENFITELKFLISNPVLSNPRNYMINFFSGQQELKFIILAIKAIKCIINSLYVLYPMEQRNYIIEHIFNINAIHLTHSY